MNKIAFDNNYSVVGSVLPSSPDADSNVNVNNSRNSSVAKQPESSGDGEDLDKYNSHQYWYVCPNLPLDPEIIDAGRSISKKRLQKNAVLGLNASKLIHSVWEDNDNEKEGRNGSSSTNVAIESEIYVSSVLFLQRLMEICLHDDILDPCFT